MSSRLGRRLTCSPAAAALGIYIGAAILWTLPVWVDPSNRLIGVNSYSDAPQEAWRFEWVPYALTHGLNPLHTTLVNFPVGANLMWTLPPIALTLAFWPVTSVAGPAVAYNGAVIAAIATSGWAAYFACRQWASGWLAPIVGGAMFEFSPYVVGQATSHLVLAAVWTIPVALIILNELVVVQRLTARRSGILLGLVAAVQLLTEEEVLASTALIALVGVALLAALHRHAIRLRLQHAAKGLAWACLTFVPLAAYPVVYQFVGPGAIHGQIWRLGPFSADVLSFVVPGYLQGITTQATVNYAASLGSEVGTYLGVPLVLLLTVTRPWRRGAAAAFFVLLGLSVAVLTLGPVLHFAGRETGVVLPAFLLARVPLLENLLPIRLSVFLDLCIAIACAQALPRLRAGRHVRGLRLLAIVALAAWLPRLVAPVYHVATPAYFTHMRPASRRVLLVLPYNAVRLPIVVSMLWQAESQMRFATPEGAVLVPAGPEHVASDGGPDSQFTLAAALIGLGGPGPVITPRFRREALRYLSHHRVTAVVAGPQPRLRRVVRFVDDVLGRPPRRTGGVDVWPIRSPVQHP